MDKQYERFCVVDPQFYDSLTSVRRQSTWFAAARRPVPQGWRRETLDDWLIYAPLGASLPDQGWKMHVSVCLDNADRVLDQVFSYCQGRGLSFKFIHGRAALLLRNAKYARRGTSGKFITIYPRDEAELELAGKELTDLLDGEPGPYVLSDLRLGDGPVYVRYGGFASRHCIVDGVVEPAIADPSGTLVPDRREPVFSTPPWVSLPRFLEPHLAARNATTVVDLPYSIDEVIHFSNGGGLYAGTDTRTGARVVLKEARPHAGLDADGVDAVTRLAREHAALERLSDLASVPRVHGRFSLGGHEFLALEYLDATPLNKLLVERYPLIDADAGAERYRDYSRWALHIYRQIEQTIAAIHERGLVYGDLHLFNVLVRTDGPEADTIALVDFEVAAPVDGYRRPALRNQGFAAPRTVGGPGVDLYALACLRLALFLPLTAMLRLAPSKAAHFAEVIGEQFNLPDNFLTEAVATITAPSTAVPVVRSPQFRPDKGEWTRLRKLLADPIVDSATPQRDDRLFPGDIEQFHSGGLTFAYGAAGVLYALAVTGAGRFPDLEDWLVRRALRPQSGSRLGFYDGLHGVAYTLHHLGRHREALDLVEVCLREKWDELGPDLMSGLAGVGLNLLHLADATGEPVLRDAAMRAVDLLSDRLAGLEPDGPAVSGGRQPHAGLTHGWTGPALLFLRRYEQTGDATLLDRAVTAISRDLHRCVVRDDGAMEVNEGWRTMPYLAQGSIGIGIVVDQLLTYRFDERLVEASAAISRAARSPFYAQSGLFAGRAGIIRYLAGKQHGPASPPQENAASQAQAGSTSTAQAGSASLTQAGLASTAQAGAASLAQTGAASMAQAGSASRVEVSEQLGTQIRHLAWHAVPFGSGLAFPGEQLLRLSMDLATGSAGVLLALGSALHDETVDLPFLAPKASPRPGGNTEI